MKKILVIEDDCSIAEIIKDYLSISGFKVSCAFDGNEGISMLAEDEYDLVVLDIMLPGKNGYEILNGIAEDKKIPVLIVSAKSDEMNIIKALNLGADDYITKPFGMGEFVARVNNHIKKYEQFSGVANRLIQINSLTIDKRDRRVIMEDGTEIPLTQKEFDLFLFLAERPNVVYGREELFEKVWGYDALSDATTVTVHVARIRRKLPKDCQCLETAWGTGYRFNVYAKR